MESVLAERPKRNHAEKEREREYGKNVHA